MAYNTYIDNKSYKRYEDSGKLVHRVAAEIKLNRKLKPGEVVHHKDRNKINNSFNNLYVFKNQEQHDWIHKKDARRFGKKASYQGFKKKSKW
jgi:HNH endonuclease